MKFCDFLVENRNSRKKYNILGQFSMDVLDENVENRGGKRNVKALINPHLRENWVSMSTDIGLVALAIAYREKYYKNPELFHLEISAESIKSGKTETAISDHKSTLL